MPAGEEEEMSSEDELEEEDDDVEEQDNSRSESPESDSAANKNKYELKKSIQKSIMNRKIIDFLLLFVSAFLRRKYGNENVWNGSSIWKPKCEI